MKLTDRWNVDDIICPANIRVEVYKAVENGTAAPFSPAKAAGQVKPQQKPNDLFHYKLPFLLRVIFDEDRKTTVVLWDDGDRTVVRCGEGETFDRYTGFMAAVCKKLFGGTTTAKKLMNFLDKDYQAKLKVEADAKEKEKRMAEEEERRKKAAKRRDKEYDDRLRELVEYYLMKRDAKKIADEIMKKAEAEAEEAPPENEG